MTQKEIPSTLQEAAAEHLWSYLEKLDPIASNQFFMEVGSWEPGSTHVVDNCPIVYNQLDNSIVYFDVVEQ